MIEALSDPETASAANHFLVLIIEFKGARRQSPGRIDAQPPSAALSRPPPPSAALSRPQPPSSVLSRHQPLSSAISRSQPHSAAIICLSSLFAGRFPPFLAAAWMLSPSSSVPRVLAARLSRSQQQLRFFDLRAAAVHEGVDCYVRGVPALGSAGTA